MSQNQVLEVFNRTILLILTLAGPLLLVSIALGLLVSVFQAATQINEQTMTFVPKVLAIAFILIMSGSWMLSNITEFFHYLLDIMSGL